MEEIEITERKRLADAIVADKDGNLVAHAQCELAGAFSRGGMDAMMARHLVDMARVFSAEGHSGFSGSYAVAALQKLLRFEPLGPLTGEDSEWTILDYDERTYAQNKRCSHVFKRADGTAYDINAVVFREPNGSCFTGRYSRVDVTFPYTPITVYADVPENYTEDDTATAAAGALIAI